MRIIKQIASVLLILLAFTAVTFAQEDVLRPKATKVSYDEPENKSGPRTPFIIGIEGGLNYNMFSQSMTWASPVPQSLYNTFSTGAGMSPFFGALVDFNLTDKLGLQLKLNYDIKNYSNKYTGIADGTYFQTGQREDVSETFEYESKSTYMVISALIRYNITKELFLLVGPDFQLPMGDFTQTNTISILTPGFYWDMNTLQTVKTETVKISSPKTRIGLEAGLGYKIHLSKTIFLVPQARFQFVPTKVADDESGLDGSRILFGTPALDAKDKMLNSFQFALAFWFEV